MTTVKIILATCIGALVQRTETHIVKESTTTSFIK